MGMDMEGLSRSKGIHLLMGRSMRDVAKLSWPMVLGMLFQTLYNVVDGMWVAGLGGDALAAVGLFFPMFMVLIAISSGLGIGGGSAVSRRVGRGDRGSASLVASQTVFMAVLFGGLVSSFFPFMGELMKVFGVEGKVLEMSVDYAEIMLLGSVPLMFFVVLGCILQGEGETKRAMYAMGASSLLNVILDPVFIYGLHMGVKGTAWATLVSLVVGSVIVFMWFAPGRSRFVSLGFKIIPWRWDTTFEILRVGIPSTLSQLLMALSVMLLNLIVVRVGGSLGLAVFTGSWRVVMVGSAVLTGIGMGVTAVVAASFGEGNRERLRDVYVHGVRLGMLVGLVLSLFMVVFSPFISKLFSYTSGSRMVYGGIVESLRVLPLFLPFAPMGMFTSSMFQGIGHGEKAFFVSVLRGVVMQLLLGYLLGVVFGFGLLGVWWGIAIGNAVASVVSFAWGMKVVASMP